MQMEKKERKKKEKKKRPRWTEKLVAVHSLATSGVYLSSDIVLPHRTFSTLQHKTIL